MYISFETSNKIHILVCNINKENYTFLKKLLDIEIYAKCVFQKCMFLSGLESAPE